MRWQVEQAQAGQPFVIEVDGEDAIMAEVPTTNGRSAPEERPFGQLELTAGETMSAPLVGVEPESFLFVAIGRMARLGLRHLAVLDSGGRPVGLLTARRLLRQRASQALIVGDAVGAARRPEDLKAVQDGMLELAEALLAEGVEAPEVAAVISAVLREISARAAALAAAEVESEQGPAPAPWAYLVLGSGGRGESLLSADQDNALVHGGSQADDAWFARLGERASAILDGAGIPYCKGGVMASRPAWRHSLEGWAETIEGWVGRAEGENLLSVDIFYDFQRVHGDAGLAEALRARAAAAARRPMLPRMMAQELEALRAPLTLLGGFRDRGDRLDLKLHGLFPIVAGARAMALRHGVAETSSAARLQAVAARGLLGEADLAGLLEARRLFMTLILDQQIRDLRAGAEPGTQVEIASLPGPLRDRLRRALRQAASIHSTVTSAVAAG
ncbi:MAG: DUF294 nucleotidyltransferase-like domain-containing protein [Tistlia sp.]